MPDTDPAPELLAALLADHGLAARTFRRIPTGKFNTSWIAELAGDGEVVLRVAPPDDAGFLFYERGMMAQEPGLHRLLRERTDIPVAAILAYDDTRRRIDRDFLVMERLPGQALSDARVAPGAVARVHRQVGAHLRALHDRCRAPRYGYLGEHRCMEPADTWADAFDTMWNRLVDDIHDCGGYDRAEADTARAALARHRRVFERDVPAALLHMDIWAQNILIDAAGNVTGLVDWDRALWGDVEIEFAVLDYCGVSTDAFWQGYDRSRDVSGDADIRRVFYTLYELQKYIVIRALRGPGLPAAAPYRAEALRVLRRM